MKRPIVNILTIFPDAVREYTETSILKRAQDKKLAELNIVDIRGFSEDKHNKVDDLPYGGGPGMVMRADIIVRALESLKKPGQVILLEPGGERFDQTIAEDLSGEDLTLVCGRYTGVDHRVRNFVDRIISIGEYILSGGELAALVVAEAAIRLIPGVLGDHRSLEEDKGYPIYTRPAEFRGLRVPDVLLSGDHKKIQNFRDQEAGDGENN